MEEYYLCEIKPEYYESIKEYQKEMIESDSSFDGCSSLEKFDDIEKWHLNCILFENIDTVPPGYSLGYEYLYINNNEVVGMVNIRPEALNHKYLKEFGGHIGYSIKPSKRRRGLATRMLKDTLKLCKDKYHLDKVLVTCNKTNDGSRKVIMNNNGIYENDIYYSPDEGFVERYWINI